MVHLMTRNRFALGKFVAMMLVIVFLISIPAAYIGAAASNQKQAAIREAMDEILARIKEKSVITLEDYEELKAILDQAGGAGKYELDINIVRPHEHLNVDDRVADVPVPRTDIPLDPGTGTHVHSEACLAHSSDGSIIDYVLRCGPNATGTLEVDGHTCEPCTDGRYIISDINMTTPSDALNISSTDFPSAGTYETDGSGLRYIKLALPYSVTYADGTTVNYDGFQSSTGSNGFGPVLTFEGTPRMTADSDTQTVYRYTLPSDTRMYFYGFSADPQDTAFFKPGNNPGTSYSEFYGSTVGNLAIYKAAKCQYCGHFYNPDDNMTLVSGEGEDPVYEERCPYCAAKYTSYEANYDPSETMYVEYGSDALTEFQLKGTHPDGNEELITGWTYDQEAYATSTGSFDIEITFHEEVTAACTDAEGNALPVPVTNDYSITIPAKKILCVCTNTANHPGGKTLYYIYDDSEGGLGDACPFCSRSPQVFVFFDSNLIASSDFHLENMENVHLSTGLGDIPLDYVSGGTSSARGWTYAAATEEELEANEYVNTDNLTWFHVRAWDYFSYTSYDPETRTITDDVADENEFDKYVGVVRSDLMNSLERCDTCHQRRIKGTECQYCKKKIKNITIYKKGTQEQATSMIVQDYYWGSTADIVSAFDVIAEYNDGHTENLSEEHPEWLSFAKEAIVSTEGGPVTVLQPVSILPGKNVLSIALVGTGDGTTMPADTTAMIGEMMQIPLPSLGPAYFVYSPVYKPVSVINHTIAAPITIVQKVYKCENELPDELNYDMPDLIVEEGAHFIIADDEGVCPECPTCKHLLTDIECTINPLKYQVSEYGWDGVEDTFINGHNYFKARSAAGTLHDLLQTDSPAGTYFQSNITVDYDPTPGKSTATITFKLNHLVSRAAANGGTTDTVLVPVIYDPQGQDLSGSLSYSDMECTFEIEIYQDIYKCDTCNKYHHADENGDDPGCPYCGHKLVAITPDPNAYGVPTLDGDYDLPSIFTITAVYEDGTEVTSYIDDTGTHTISDACTFTPHADNPAKYTVTYAETVTVGLCDEHGTPTQEVLHNSATTEVELRLNLVRCEVCGNHYQNGYEAKCPYCEAMVDSIWADVESISCSVSDLDDLSGFFKVYGKRHNGDEFEIDFDDLEMTYTPGQLAISYTNRVVADCLTAEGAPNPITINDTLVTTVEVELSGRVECPRCHYFYDLGDLASTYSPEFDIQAHCPYCDYIFYSADGDTLDSFRTVGFSSYELEPGEDVILPGSIKTSNANGTQAAPGTYAVIEKGLTISRILGSTVIERDSDPDHPYAISEGAVSWADGDVTLTVTADDTVNTYNPSLTGYQVFTAVYTAKFKAYTSSDQLAQPENITQTCDVTLLLDIYDSCRYCKRMYSPRAVQGNCPHCSLDTLTAAPAEFDEELGLLRNLRLYLTVTAKFADGHTEVITSDENTAGNDFTDNFDPDLRGEQDVTISLEDLFENVRTATVRVKLTSYWVCPYCLKRYPLNEDGTAPTCEECAGTYVKLSAAPATLTEEWSPTMTASDIKGWITVRVQTKDGEWHELTSGAFDTDFMPSRGIGQRVVTVSATDDYRNTVTTTLEVTLFKEYTCPVCSHVYTANPDGSDPGCPLCPTVVTGYEAGLNKTAYNIDEEPDMYFRLVYRDGHKEDKLAQTTNNFDSRSAGERTLIIYYQGTEIQAGTYTVTNHYLVTCPNCGHVHDSRDVSYSISDKGYCPDCENETVGLSVRPTAAWLVPGTSNKVYYGTEPDLIVEFVSRNGNRSQVYDFEYTGYNPYNTASTQTITVTAFGYTGSTEVLVVKKGQEESGSGGSTDPVVITIDGVGYASCSVCSHYYDAGLSKCPYCSFAEKYSSFIDDPDSDPGFKLKAGSAEYQAFSNVMNGDSDLVVLDEILDDLYSLPGIIEKVNAESDPEAKAVLLGLNEDQTEEYLSAYAKLTALQALKEADPDYTYSDGELGQMAYLRRIIDHYEMPGYILNENDVVIITIRKIRPNVFDYLNNLFSDNYEATYFTASAVISKSY